jgi:hypothetical protein
MSQTLTTTSAPVSESLSRLRVAHMTSKETRRIVDEFDDRCESFPLFCEGESKIVREITQELVIVRLKPTLFSYKANRAGVVAGTDSLRLQISRILWNCLAEAGVYIPIKGVDSSCRENTRLRMRSSANAFFSSLISSRSLFIITLTIFVSYLLDPYFLSQLGMVPP